MASYQAYLQQLLSQNNPNDPTSYLNPNAVGDFNDPTIDGSGYGALTGAGQLQTYYAYFNAITSTSPEIPDQTAYFIKYLIDKDGNVIKPQPGEVSAINLKDNFEAGKIATATARTPTVLFSDLLGDKPITHVGEISTILVSNTGSSPQAYVTTMSFEDITGANLDTFPFDYNFAVKNVASSYDPWGAGINAQSLNYNTGTSGISGRTIASSTGFSGILNEPDPSAATWNGGTGKYTFVEPTTNSNRVKFYFKMNLKVFRIREAKVGGNCTVQDGSYASVNVRYIVQRFSDGVILAQSPWITVDNTSYNQYPEWTSQFLSFQAGDEIKFGIQYDQNGSEQTSENTLYRFYNNNLYAFTQNAGGGTGLVQVINENNNFSGLVNGINIATAPYWYVGSYPTDPSAVYTQTTILTASLGMAQLYRPNMIYSLHPSCSAYGYSRPWQTYYKLLPGDKIIFENNKNSTHTIYEIIENEIFTPEGSSSFGLKLFPGIVSGSNLDNFCIYRIIDNGTYIILDQKKPDISGSLQGFLRPKYITQELSDSIKDTTYRLDVDGLLDQ